MAVPNLNWKNSAAVTFFCDWKSLQLYENKSLLFKTSGLWCFVMAVHNTVTKTLLQPDRVTDITGSESEIGWGIQCLQ